MKNIAWDNVIVFAIITLYVMLVPIWGISPWPVVALGAVWAYANRS